MSEMLSPQRDRGLTGMHRESWQRTRLLVAPLRSSALPLCLCGEKKDEIIDVFIPISKRKWLAGFHNPNAMIREFEMRAGQFNLGHVALRTILALDLA